MDTIDSSDWAMEAGEARLIAIGDIHGDLDALLRILLGLSLVNEAGDWAGGTSILVLIGDLNDRGPDSFSVICHVMALEAQARAAGGTVVSLLGNHELLVASGDYRFVRASEVLALEHVWIDDRHGLDAVFRGNSRWAIWLRERPAVVRIDRTVFIHAGVGSWALDWSTAALNGEMRKWMAHRQGVAEEPDEATFWMTTDKHDGPVWNRAFAARASGEAGQEGLPAHVAEVLAFWGSDRMVVGHSPTKSLGYAIAWPHPQLGKAVALIDTGISYALGGRLSALEMAAGGQWVAHYFERGGSASPLAVSLRQYYLAELRGAALRESSPARCGPWPSR